MVARRWSALALVSLLAAAAACGSDSSSEGGATTTAAAGTTAAATTAGGASTSASAGATTTAVAAECDDGDVVKVGASFSISGPAADIGAQAKEGAELAIADLNKAGGVLGRCAELVLKDDGGDPTKAAQVMRELVDQDEVDYVVGPFLSSPIGVTIEVTTPAKVPQVIGGVLPAAGDAAKYPYVFRTAVVATLQGTTFVEYMKESGQKRAGILAVNNALGTSNVDALKAAIGDSGIEIVATELHESGTVDLAPQLKKVLDADPDVLLLFSTAAPDQIAAVKARKTLGSDLPMLGFSSLAYAGTAAELQKEDADNVYAGQYYRRLSREPGSSEPIGGEATSAFIAQLAEARNETTLTVGSEQQAGQYDSVMMIAKAANEVGDLDADKIREYLEANGYDGVRASYTYDAERHDGVGLDDLVFSVPITLENGTAELAPNQ